RQIALIVAEAADMALVRILEHAAGAALTAQIESRDPQAHGIEMADGFEIALDELVAAVQEDDGSARRRDVRTADRIAQLHAAVAGEIAGRDIVWRRIVGSGVENIVHRVPSRLEEEVQAIGDGAPRSRKKAGMAGFAAIPAGD